MAGHPLVEDYENQNGGNPDVEEYENQNGGSTRRRRLRESKWRFNPSSKTTRIKMAVQPVVEDYENQNGR